VATAGAVHPLMSHVKPRRRDCPDLSTNRWEVIDAMIVQR
jgi:hypothetical protein